MKSKKRSVKKLSVKKMSKKKTSKKPAAKKKTSQKKPAVPKKVSYKAIPKDELEAYKKRLLIIRAKLTGDVSRLEQDGLMNTRDASGDLSGYGLHMADAATDNFDQELNLGLASSEQQLLNRVESALKRLEDGVFGFSIKSGRPISKKRLNAVPYAELTIEEQEEEEKKTERG
jgi:DnaK suppressor protein